MTTQEWSSLLLGGIGTATGVTSLIWHMLRARKDRTTFDLQVHKMTWFALTPEQVRGVEIHDRDNPFVEVAPPGLWVKFTGRLVNTGLRDGSITSIRVGVPSAGEHDGEGCFPTPPLAITVDAGKTSELAFWYHATQRHDTGVTLPEKLPCHVVLEDQEGHKYSFALSADRAKPETFGVTRRRH